MDTRIKFFISLENDAGVPLSQFIMRKSKTIRANGARKGAKKTAAAGTTRNQAIPPAVDQSSNQASWYDKVLEKFPTFDPAWPDEVKLKWFDAFDTLLKKGVLTEH